MHAPFLACVCVPTAILLAAWWDFPLVAVSRILFPYYINRAAFAAVYYAACGILWVIESFVAIFEVAFGSIIKEMILAPFRASGVSARVEDLLGILQRAAAAGDVAGVAGCARCSDDLCGYRCCVAFLIGCFW